MLSYTNLCTLVGQGIMTPVKPESINASSIDVHLGPTIIFEQAPPEGSVHHTAFADPAARVGFPSQKHNLETDGDYMLMPGEFVLAQTAEIFNLPLDISAEFRLKSSGARCGLNNLFACHCDAGWHGSVLTLELHNTLRYTPIRLSLGMPVGQMIFHRHKAVPRKDSYAQRGRYNGDKQAQSIKE